jgi:hypothetical protein
VSATACRMLPEARAESWACGPLPLRPPQPEAGRRQAAGIGLPIAQFVDVVVVADLRSTCCSHPCTSSAMGLCCCCCCSPSCERRRPPRAPWRGRLTRRAALCGAGSRHGEASPGRELLEPLPVQPPRAASLATCPCVALPPLPAGAAGETLRLRHVKLRPSPRGLSLTVLLVLAPNRTHTHPVPRRHGTNTSGWPVPTPRVRALPGGGVAAMEEPLACSPSPPTEPHLGVGTRVANSELLTPAPPAHRPLHTDPCTHRAAASPLSACSASAPDALGLARLCVMHVLSHSWRGATCAHVGARAASRLQPLSLISREGHAQAPATPC